MKTPQTEPNPDKAERLDHKPDPACPCVACFVRCRYKADYLHPWQDKTGNAQPLEPRNKETQ